MFMPRPVCCERLLACGRVPDHVGPHVCTTCITCCLLDGRAVEIVGRPIPLFSACMSEGGCKHVSCQDGWIHPRMSSQGFIS
jgi:hypothetical protein